MATMATVAGAAPGELDGSFGVGGSAAFPVPVGSEHAEDMVVGPADEIFTLQRANSCGSTGCVSHLYIERFSPDGMLDPSFGKAGIGEAFELPQNAERAPQASLALTPSGQLLVAVTDRGDISVVRFSPSGQIDGSFGTGGVIRLDLNGEETSPRVAVQPTGDIVLAMQSNLGIPRRNNFVIVLRLLPTGAIDTSFAAGAKGAGFPGTLALRGFHSGELGISNMGRIALGASRCCGQGSKVYVGRRGVNGQTVPGFASGSQWRNYKLGPHATVDSVIPLPNERIYVTGTAGDGAFALKLRPSGRPYRSFGRRGLIRMRAIDRDSIALVDDFGRLLVAGAGEIATEFEPQKLEGLVVRRLPNGRIDRNWGFGLPVRISGRGPSSAWLNRPLAIALQSTGRVVVFGSREEECIRFCPGPRTTMIRLLAGRAR